LEICKLKKWITAVVKLIKRDRKNSTQEFKSLIVFRWNSNVHQTQHTYTWIDDFDDLIISNNINNITLFSRFDLAVYYCCGILRNQAKLGGGGGD